jgi:lysyl-tRNA synthetase class 2
MSPEKSSPPSDQLHVLTLRSTAFSAVRSFFLSRDYLEVDTPLLVTHPGLEPHLDPIAADAKDGAERFLITSPEHHMKRLVAAGAGKIFQLSHVFRAGEVTRRHRAEFCLLEWYQSHLSLDGMMEMTEALVRHVAAAIHVPLQSQPFARTTCSDAMRAHAKLALDPSDEPAFVAVVKQEAKAQAGAVRDGFDFDDAFHWVMGERVEPALSKQGPTFVTRWPAQMAALARRCQDDVRFAERFELYASDLELCNGYFELTDAAEQRARFEADNHKRVALGKRALPIDEALLASLPSMPPTSGNALGVDRLLMALTGRAEIAAVLS